MIEGDRQNKGLLITGATHLTTKHCWKRSPGKLQELKSLLNLSFFQYKPKLKISHGNNESF